MQDSQPAATPPSRRGFFFGLAGVGAAATAVAVLPGVDVPAAPTDAPATRRAPEKGGGYSLSEHVKRYYRSTFA